MRALKDKPADVASTLSILHKWGVHTVGAFAALDKEEVSKRLGPVGVELWERATGKSVRLLKLIEPPETFEEQFDFENEIETIDPLLFMLRRFLQQLTTRLQAIYLVADQLILTLRFSDRTEYRREFKIPQPANDVDLLFRMLHTHLENFKSPHPISAVGLTIRPVKPAAQQFGLFETALRNPMQLAETLARLVALLGRERLGTPQVQETHRPDTFQMEPFQWAATAVSHAGVAKRSIALRRFRTAPGASVLTDNNRPVHLRSTPANGAVRGSSGPYLRSGDWWDCQRWSRVEWDLQLGPAGVVRAHSTDAGQWRVDGIYD